MRFLQLVGVSASLGLSGCGLVLGLGDFTNGTDGAGGTGASASSASSGAAGEGGHGGTGGNGGSSGGGTTTTVKGSDVPIFVVPAGETSQAVDLGTDHFIAALVPDGADYTTLVGKGLSNGTFSIDAVPRGHYFLNVDKVYYWLDTAGPQPELGPYVLGRTTQTTATATTMVTFDVTGMNPWTPQDDIQIVSFQANAYSALQFANYGNKPVAGETTFAAFTDWHANVFPPTLLALADTLWLLQLEHKVTSTGLDYAATVKAASISGVAMQDAQAITLAGAFDSVVTSKTTTLDLPVTDYEALVPAVHPKATPDVYFYGVDVLPSGADHGVYTGTVDLVVVHPPPGADIAGATLSYASPFLSAFTEICAVIFDVTVPYQLTGANPLNAPAAMRYMDVLSACASGPIGVKLSPPTSIQIDGKAGTADQTLASSTPTISWGPPAIGTARNYDVFVNRLYTGNGNTKREVVARIDTDGTSVKLPSGILKSSEKYYIVVRAFSTPAPAYGAFPNRSQLPQAEVAALTGMLSVP